MAKLTADERAALKPSQFGLPDKARTKKARKEPGNYPMPDEAHTVSAVRLAKKHTRGRQTLEVGLQEDPPQGPQDP